MKFFPSMISSVYTDGNIQSVVTNWITDGMFRIKKKTVRWRGGFCGWFLPTESPTDSKLQLRMVMWPVHRLKCWRNYRGIRNGRSVRWRVDFSIRIADGRTDELFRWWNRWKKLIYALSPDPLLPYFSFFFLIPTLPICKQPAPPNKNLHHLSTTSYISWSFVVTTSVFWFTEGFYQFL